MTRSIAAGFLVHAITFSALSLPVQAASIASAPVGDAGNPADSNGAGSVGYSYQIDKFEVTNSQYAEFLNAVAKVDTFGVYNANMGIQGIGGITVDRTSGFATYAVKPGYDNLPVNYVDWLSGAVCKLAEQRPTDRH